jgi:hypothetical protein
MDGRSEGCWRAMQQFAMILEKAAIKDDRTS